MTEIILKVKVDDKLDSYLLGSDGITGYTYALKQIQAELYNQLGIDISIVIDRVGSVEFTTEPIKTEQK